VNIDGCSIEETKLDGIDLYGIDITNAKISKTRKTYVCPFCGSENELKPESSTTPCPVCKNSSSAQTRPEEKSLWAYLSFIFALISGPINIIFLSIFQTMLRPTEIVAMASMISGLILSFSSIVFGIASIINFIRFPALSGRGLAISGILISLLIFTSCILLIVM
jgi:hypothetical protein